MPGQIPGLYFKAVMSSMLTSSALFPAHKQRIEAMNADALYAWDDYLSLLREIDAKLPANVVVGIGRKVMQQTKRVLEQQGFGSLDAIMRDWAKTFTANVQGAPSHDVMRTESYSPGHAVLLAGAAQPVAVIEGYARGAVEMFGRWVASVEATQVRSGAHEFHRIAISW